MRVESLNIQNTNFSSRNTEIRIADNLSRNVMRTVPMISVRKYMAMSNYPVALRSLIRMNSNFTMLREELKSIFTNPQTEPVEKIKIFLEKLKKQQMGMCTEATEVSAIFAHLAGIKNVSAAGLRTQYGDHLDHMFLLVEDKKPYIIDSLFGFADFIPNAFLKYKTIFRNHFKFEGFDTEKLTYEKYKKNDVISNVEKLTEADDNKIRELLR